MIRTLRVVRLGVAVLLATYSLTATAALQDFGSTPIISPALMNAPSGATIGRIRVADMNGDGRMDVIGTANASGTGYWFVALGNGNGTSTPGAPHPLGFLVDNLFVADVNEDGLPDVLAAHNPFIIQPLPALLAGLGDGSLGPVQYLPEIGRAHV